MNEHPKMTYLPRSCALRNQEAWAILIEQTDGEWKIVNCLDKDTECFSHECVFTTDGGGWPFRELVRSVPKSP